MARWPDTNPKRKRGTRSEDSIALARSCGVDVVELDLTVSFTAARARNAGFERLRQLSSEVEFVQFVDGDCELDAGWIDAGVAAMLEHSDVAAVAGHLRERFPESSVYNRLCDLEWEAPAGATREVGGVAMFRCTPFSEVGGFCSTLIAGEEPELCHRLRGRGWQIRRLAVPMGWHDAAITRFRQWWRRNVRAGHAYAECCRLHRSSAEPLWRREVRGNWLWGMVLPLIAIAAAPFTWGLSLLLLLAYPLQMVRIYLGRRRRGDITRHARVYAYYCVLGKFPQMLGQFRFHLRRWLARPPRILEYKGPTSAATPA
jgi:hypothetical protein